MKNVSFQLTPGEITLLIAPVSTGGEAVFDALQEDRCDRCSDTHPPFTLPCSALKITGDILYNGRPTPPKDAVAVVSVRHDRPPSACDLTTSTQTKTIPVDATCVGHAVQRSVQAAHAGRKADVGALTESLLAAAGLSHVKYSPLSELEDAPEGTHLLRRCALACALASNPVVLLMQEPFSEATAEQSASLVNLLRRLADGGRTVVLGSEEGLDDAQYATVDTTCVLSKGRIMYLGVASEAVSWFAAQGHAKPAGQAVADFLVNLVSMCSGGWWSVYCCDGWVATMHVDRVSARCVWLWLVNDAARRLMLLWLRMGRRAKCTVQRAWRWLRHICVPTQPVCVCV